MNFVLAAHIDFSSSAKTRAEKEAATEGLSDLKGVGQARARIYDAFIKSGRIYDYKKQTGITKKSLEKANKKYIISSGRYRGSEGDDRKKA